ncbi:hypothetical protein [Chryseobacterium arthrosphaerae]|nr:hypothetical protein [Chryseobacterium arthrosphaerae]
MERTFKHIKKPYYCRNDKYKTACFRSSVREIFNSFKMGGRIVGGIGIANSIYQGIEGNISPTRTAVDIVMGAVGFMGSWEAAASLVYFGGMAIYETNFNDGKAAF